MLGDSADGCSSARPRFFTSVSLLRDPADPAAGRHSYAVGDAALVRYERPGDGQQDDLAVLQVYALVEVRRGAPARVGVWTSCCALSLAVHAPAGCQPSCAHPPHCTQDAEGVAWVVPRWAYMWEDIWRRDADPRAQDDECMRGRREVYLGAETSALHGGHAVLSEATAGGLRSGGHPPRSPCPRSPRELCHPTSRVLHPSPPSHRARRPAGRQPKHGDGPAPALYPVA